ncbi:MULTISPECIES: thioesterase family protein [Cohaesibacter]|uniref:thioesterase family protein n=1 Tax=Cohaesibacter TaxID=655352 RepID=UPI000DEA20B3|nr:MULTISPECIES: thioesterase family protein [Cohaesibacter]TLP43807.1 acyl-ACP thioesterase [Cohaesibacter sp. CAU 1516]
MTRFVTLNQYINTWECDENDHMNVQFYFSMFDDASKLFASCNKMEDAFSKRISRHVRFHSELRSGSQVRILTSLVTPETDDGMPESGCFVQHVMENITNGLVAASALDLYEGTAWPSHANHQDKIDDNVMPRALKHDADFSLKSPEDFGETLIGRGIVHPAMCDATGHARDQAYISAASDVGSHAWAQVGMNSNWLKVNGFGRVSIEMRLCVLEGMKAGDQFSIHVAFTSLQPNMFTMRYDFFDIRDGRHIAFVDTAAMVFSVATRRSNHLPDFAKEAIKERMI